MIRCRNDNILNILDQINILLQITWAVSLYFFTWLLGILKLQVARILSPSDRTARRALHYSSRTEVALSSLKHHLGVQVPHMAAWWKCGRILSQDSKESEPLKEILFSAWIQAQVHPELKVL